MLRHSPFRPLCAGAMLALAPAGAAGAGGSAPALTVAEVVTFRLADGMTEAAFRAAAAATVPLAARQPGFIARTLSRGDDGRWTDHVLWADRAAAEAAAATVMADPVAAPFIAAIDMDSVVMRHETVLPLAPRP